MHSRHPFIPLQESSQDRPPLWWENKKGTRRGEGLSLQRERRASRGDLLSIPGLLLPRELHLLSSFVSRSVKSPSSAEIKVSLGCL